MHIRHDMILRIVILYYISMRLGVFMCSTTFLYPECTT